MKIRQALETDIKQILPLMLDNAIASKMKPEDLKVKSIVYILQRAIANDEVCTLVAEEDGSLVGAIGLTTIPRADDIEKVEAHETAFWVDPKSRKKGAGGALVRAAEKWCVERGITRIYFQALLDDSDYARLDAMLMREGYAPFEMRYVKEI